jgi:hypothetical protein
VFLVQSDLTYKNKTLSAGTPTFSWASNAAYCGPDGPLVDRCEGGIFNWTQHGNNCESLNIYDPKNPDNLIVGIERICKIPPIAYLLNTTYWLPWPSALRLAGWAYFIPIVNGTTPEGNPRVVDHVQGDMDNEALLSLALLDRVTGPRARDFVGVLNPLGVAVLPGSTMRLGSIYIDPDQPTFPPNFPFNLLLP